MYRVDITRRAIRDIAGLPQQYPRLVSQRIRDLAEDPRPRGASRLRGSGQYRLRVGIYRVIYEVDDEARVATIRRVQHRRDVYR